MPYFFASPKKYQKKSPEIDYIAISGWHLDLTVLLLWCPTSPLRSGKTEFIIFQFDCTLKFIFAT